MKVLAIDPGFGRCGVAVLDGNSTKSALLYSACIETSSKKTFFERIIEIGTVIESLINEYNPECVALEEVYFSTNQKTVFHVAEVRGAILYIALSHKLPVHEYNPNSVKIALVGYGRATKDQVTAMVERLIEMPKKKRLDDEYDAIAVGLTALAQESRNYKNR